MPMMPQLKVEAMPVSELVPYAGNAKEHPERQVEQIAASIENFGFADPVGVWTRPDGMLEIVEGHGRVMAAKLLGIESVPVIRLDHLDDDGRRAYAHVHNQTTLTSGFDMDALQLDLGSIPGFDWSDFGFDLPTDWFADRDRWDASREEGNDEYNVFLDKFEPKKTTDDCYTPDAVYDAVADWVAEEYGRDRSTFVRPFYPGGDYRDEEYPEGCVVVDNPPFSILSEIVRFYCENEIPFFLFAPTLTLFSGRNCDVTYIAADCDVTYENGAKVNTSFITNMDGDYIVRTAPILCERVSAADELARAERSEPVLKYRYPPYVITSAMVGAWSALGVDFRVRKGSAECVSGLDAQKEVGKAIYGCGYLLSEAAKADAEAAKADAEAAKALKAAKALGDTVEVEPDGTVVWKLSERELRIVAGLG